jgi:hypothetical protein
VTRETAAARSARADEPASVAMIATIASVPIEPRAIARRPVDSLAHRCCG